MRSPMWTSLWEQIPTCRNANPMRHKGNSHKISGRSALLATMSFPIKYMKNKSYLRVEAINNHAHKKLFYYKARHLNICPFYMQGLCSHYDFLRAKLHHLVLLLDNILYLLLIQF